MPYLTGNTTQLGSATATTGSAAAYFAGGSLTDTCTIQRKQLTDDGQGTSAIAWVDVAVDTPCRFSKVVNENERVEGGVLQANSTWTVEVSLGTDLQPSYRVLKGTDVFQVVDTDDGLSNPLFLTATLIRSRNEAI